MLGGTPIQADYLTQERMLSPETVERYGIEVREDCIYIPVGGTARLYFPNGEPKIKWQRAFTEGESMPLFGSLSDDDREVLVAEGEFDAMLAQQHLPEYDVVSGTGGAPNWLPEWSAMLAGRRVVILYDADEAGRKGASQVAQSILRAGGHPRIARWPEQSPKGWDITDCIRSGSLDTLKSILALADDYVPPLTLATRAVDFVAQEIEPQSWLVDGLWPDEGIGVVFGAPEVFKSFFVLDMAFAVATGGLFLGMHQVPRQRRVLVVQMESSGAAFRDRVNKMASRFGGVPDSLYLITGKPILLEDKKWSEKLLNEIAVVQPGLVILDPLASMTAADENSAQEMGVIVRTLRSWRDQFKTSVALVHHEVKNSTGPGAQNMRGSSALHGAVEVAIRIERPDPDTPRVSVKWAKFKEGERPRPFFAEFDGEQAEFKVLTDQRMISTEQQVREFLVARGEATVSDVASALNLKTHQARDIVRSMRGIRLKAGTGQGNKPAVYYVERIASPRIGVQGATPGADTIGITQEEFPSDVIS